MKSKKNIETALIIILLYFSFSFAIMEFKSGNFTSAEYKQRAFDNCRFKGIQLHGKVKFVENFPDFTIQFVNNWGDIKVKFVEDFPEYCGEWQIEENLADFKVKVVENFADLKVEVVENDPGINQNR